MVVKHAALLEKVESLRAENEQQAADLTANENEFDRLRTVIRDRTAERESQAAELERLREAMREAMMALFGLAAAPPVARVDEPVAHKCDNGTIKPYPSLVCSGCRTPKSEADHYTVRQLCGLVARVPVAEEVSNGNKE